MPYVINPDGIALHFQESGDPKGAPLVFSNALGTDMRIWEGVLPLLPEGLRVIRYDSRGHGASDCPPTPYSMGGLIHDAEVLLDALSIKDCVFVGLSIGGMVAQGLAAKRLDLVRAVVLSNTAPKIGTRALWQDRIDKVREGGIAAVSEAVMERSFPKSFRAQGLHRPWQELLESTPESGYIGCAAAIAGSDFFTTTAALRLPALVIAGDHDGSTPPDLMRELAEMIPGAEYKLIRGTGHLPCIERPEVYAATLTEFLSQIGHIKAS